MEEIKIVVTTEDEDGEMVPYEDGATDEEFDDLVKTVGEQAKKPPANPKTDRGAVDFVR